MESSTNSFRIDTEVSSFSRSGSLQIWNERNRLNAGNGPTELSCITTRNKGKFFLALLSLMNPFSNSSLHTVNYKTKDGTKTLRLIADRTVVGRYFGTEDRNCSARGEIKVTTFFSRFRTYNFS
jgi:hypothetical protein